MIFLGVDGDDFTATASHQEDPVQTLEENFQELHVWEDKSQGTTHPEGITVSHPSTSHYSVTHRIPPLSPHTATLVERSTQTFYWVKVQIVKVPHFLFHLKKSKYLLLNILKVLKVKVVAKCSIFPQDPHSFRIQFSSPPLFLGGPGMLSRTRWAPCDLLTTTPFSLTAVCIRRTLAWFLMWQEVHSENRQHWLTTHYSDLYI